MGPSAARSARRRAGNRVDVQGVTYASEAADAAKTTSLVGAEVFPEPRTANDPTYSPALATHRFNHFFPWELNQDGTAEETLNHIGRHEPDTNSHRQQRLPQRHRHGRRALAARFASGALSLRGSAVIPPPWQGVAPHINGMRITVDGTFDIVVPGGDGWTAGTNGKRWRYVDRDGVHGGIRRIDVMDRSLRMPGKISIRLRMIGTTTLPALGAVDLAVRFGIPDESAIAHWSAPAGQAPLCRGNQLTMTCS